MSILIDKVRIKNFRSLRNVEVNLQRITLLVGANNAGKTTFLRALNTVFGVSKGFLTKDDLFIDRNGKNIKNDKGELEPIIIDVRIVPIDALGNRVTEFSTQWIGKFVGINTDDFGEFFAFRTEIVFGNGDSYETNLYPLNYWKNPETSPNNLLPKSALSPIALYFMDAQRDLQGDIQQRNSYFGKLATQLEKDYSPKDIQLISDLVKKLNDTAVAKSETLLHLKERLSELNRTTQTRGEGVSISPFSKKIRDLHKGMKVDFQDNESDTFSLEYHGMGTRSWASILSLDAFTSWEIKENEKKSEPYFPILAVEEPEAHLHPNAQRTLYNQLKKIGGQKIISTHSPYVAGQAELNELRHFYKSEVVVEVTQINLDTLSPTDQLSIKKDIETSKGEVLFSNIVVMCEGETEEIILPIFAQAYWGKSDFEMGINFIKTGKYYPLLYLLRFLKIQWYIFSDYDKPDVKSALGSVLRKNDITSMDNVVKLNDDTSQKDIEEYLFDSGYEYELRNALKQLKEPIYRDEKHKATKQADVENENLRIDSLSKEEFIKEIDNWKTKAAPLYTNLILQKENKHERFPAKIRELFDKIAVKMCERI